MSVGAIVGLGAVIYLIGCFFTFGVCCGFDDGDFESTDIILIIFWPIGLPLLILVSAVIPIVIFIMDLGGIFGCWLDEVRNR